MGCAQSVEHDVHCIDANRDGKISRQELFQYIAAHDKLWAMLAVNLNLPAQQCREIATDVAFQLAKQLLARPRGNRKRRGTKKPSRSFAQPEKLFPEEVQADREPTLAEIQAFTNFVRNPRGEQEFFHRTVFHVFDKNGNGYLDADELSHFLDCAFYQDNSIFAGDARLPASREELQRRIYAAVDYRDHCKGLDFDEIRSVLSGGASCFGVAPQ